jgi:hypothetical protein
MNPQAYTLIRMFIKKISIFFLLFLIFWVIAYPFLPYWNHFRTVYNDTKGTQYKSILKWPISASQDIKEEDIISSITSSREYSKIILKYRKMPCYFSYLKRPNNILNWDYSIYQSSSVEIMLESYTLLMENNKELMRGDFAEQASKELRELIQRCAYNDSLKNPDLVGAALFSKSASIVQAFISSGLNINVSLINSSKTKSYTPLYLAEKILKSEKNEESKQSLVKIIELLKQAGAKSEMTDLQVK